MQPTGQWMMSRFLSGFGGSWSQGMGWGFLRLGRFFKVSMNSRIDPFTHCEWKNWNFLLFLFRFVWRDYGEKGCWGGWRGIFSSFVRLTLSRALHARSKFASLTAKKCCANLAGRLSFDAAFGGIWDSYRSVWGGEAECGDMNKILTMVLNAVLRIA